MNPLQRPIVCIVVVDQTARDTTVLLQRRTKQYDDTPYNGMLELPQGKVHGNESIREAARRELKEETGLELDRFLEGDELSVDEPGWASSEVTAFRPLICVVDTKQNHLAIAVVVTTHGTTRGTREATEHSWLTLSDVSAAISRNEVFPLNVPILRELIRVYG